MNFDYYYGSECEQFAFYRIPKILFTDDAKWVQLDFDEVSEQMDIANLPGPEVFMSRVEMEFKAKTEECFRKIGNMSATDIEEHIAEYVNAKLYENDFDAEIIGVVISGSRCRGLEGKVMQMGKKPSVTADLQSKKMQVAGEKKKETKLDCKKSETVI